MSESLVCQCQITSQSLFGGGLGLRLPPSSHQSSHDEASGGTPAPALPPLMPAHPCSMRITGKLKAQSVAARKELTRPLGVPTCQHAIPHTIAWPHTGTRYGIHPHTLLNTTCQSPCMGLLKSWDRAGRMAMPHGSAAVRGSIKGRTTQLAAAPNSTGTRQHHLPVFIYR